MFVVCVSFEKIDVSYFKSKTGRPDECVKKSPKVRPNPFFVKINASLLPWKKVAKIWAIAVILKISS
jgi:hypothetical protein